MSINSTGLWIRPMTLADVDCVIALAESLIEAPHWPLTAYIRALDPGARPQRIALVAENAAERVVGFAIASLIPPQAELESIAVAAPAQRRGLARQLFSALTAEFQKQHVTEVQLEVRASNQAALALYQALGFQPAGRRPRYYAEPEEDAVLMHLSIA